MDNSDFMIEAVAQAVADFLGLPLFTTADVGHLLVALGVTALVSVVARLLCRRLRLQLRGFVQTKFDVPEETAPKVSRDLAIAVMALLTIVLIHLTSIGYSWTPYADLVFDLAIPIAAAIGAWHLAMAFNLSVSPALAFAAICAFALLSNRYEELNVIARSLDRFAIPLGESRFSVLDLLSYGFAGIVLYALVRVANRGAKAFIRRQRDLDGTQVLLAEKLTAIGIVVMAVFLGIGMLGIDTTALSVFSGTVGLGLGFGLQKIFSNLASGIILLMDRSIKPGDVIVVGDAVGVVNRIGTRAVSVITRDGKEYLIPNELLMTERVENWNFSSHNVRIRMALRVAYNSDMDLVEKLLHEATRESPRVLNKPESAVRITDFSDAGIQLELRFWIRDPEDGLGNVQSEIYRRILDKFIEHDIIMPYPGREVAIINAPDVPVKRV